MIDILIAQLIAVFIPVFEVAIGTTSSDDLYSITGSVIGIHILSVGPASKILNQDAPLLKSIPTPFLPSPVFILPTTAQ